MFSMFAFLVSFAVATVTAIVLHSSARRFVRNRLRYVDAIQKSIAPWAVGGVAFLAGALLAPILPFVGIPTAITAALAVGTGVAAGAKDIRQGVMPTVYGR